MEYRACMEFGSLIILDMLRCHRHLTMTQINECNPWILFFERHPGLEKHKWFPISIL